MAETTEKSKKSFWKLVKSEFRKIVWTDKNDLVKQTIAVILVSAVICILISVVDGLALKLIELIVG